MEIEGKHKRKLTGFHAWVVYFVAVTMSLYQIYFLTLGGIASPWVFRAGHLAFALAIVFLISPAGKKSEKNSFTILDALLAICSMVVFAYIILNLEELIMRAGVSPTKFDVIFGIITILLVLEASRRFFGPVLPLIAAVFLLYSYFGHLIHGRFSIPRYSLQRIVSYSFSTTGIYGIALSTSATYVFLFVLFGSFLNHTGIGDIFMKLSMALAGGVRGGPAKVSAISSALFGSISGSASSNVVTTGAFTIPMMKKIGYPGEFAAAVETTASIGGLFLPPIMGAGGFLMADFLQIPYSSVIKAAVVPAILYYIVLFIIIDFVAMKLELKGLPKSELPKFKDILSNDLYLIFPILVLLYFLLIVRVSPVRAGLWSILACIIVSWFKSETRVGFKRLGNILSEGARMAVNISIATATAGIIVGVLQMTGLGLTFSSTLVYLSETSTFLTLVLAMVVTIVLGMGLPITATYITVAAVVAPALIKIGITPIAAHLFLYFFAAVSGMTPPVCVTAYAAAGVAGEDPFMVGIQSMKLGWAGYLLPFMFVFGNSLLLIGSVQQIVMSIVSALVGAFAIVASLYGYGTIQEPSRRLVIRGLFGVGGLLLLHVGALTNIPGFVLVASAILLSRVRSKEQTNIKTMK
ncbi:MAG TPA: C4-dicarboxylate ABC transporter [Bacteroidales bacterium]|nr:MAG: TRAP transporter, 4TM/12TM fusion protein [Synergistales bacterium 53_16]HAL65713.1 C4-dicarboxylate ABC transporter [Bacteroidales bacterium]